MANVVNLDRVSKAYPNAVLLDAVSLGLDEADRVGVVGLNGAGKTTLLRLIAGEDNPDEGRVTHRRDLRVATLPQALDLPAQATVRQVVVGDAWQPARFAAEHEWAGDAAVRTVLDGLGLHRLGLDSAVGPMSGGERRRVALAALLVRASDVLVLDEPTNHLDLAGVRWLADHLARRRGALVVVTHDRWFLDAVCTTTWEVGGGSAAVIVGKPDFTKPVPVRLHSSCLTGDVFGSSRCDCGDQLRLALTRLNEEGGGVILYLEQEGRGLGLANKMRAYALQDEGLDTVDANTTLGFDDDERDYGIAARMLQILKCSRILLLTNNPAKLDGLTKSGIEIAARVPLEAPINPHNKRYLTAKAARSGHQLFGLKPLAAEKS